MSNYHWMLTVKLSGGDLAIAAISSHAPDPGDLVELEGGTLATVVMRSLYGGCDDAEYLATVAVVKPMKVTCWYSRNHIEEDAADESC